MLTKGYAKCFTSMMESSLWNLDTETRFIWMCLLMMCGKNGVVKRGDPPFLAAMIKVPETSIKRALDLLSAPDPHSTSKGCEGRRIVSVAENSWRIVNYEYYRDKASRMDSEFRNGRGAPEKKPKSPPPAEPPPPVDNEF